MSEDDASVASLLRTGAVALPRRTGIPDPRREASWLLARALGVSEMWLRLNPAAAVPAAAAARFRSWVAQRAAGAPAEHLVGSCPFWGRELAVSPAVLIPRPETELVVSAALALPLADTARVLDVGTGSGCLAVTLAAERPGWRVAAVDRHAACLATARANAAAHGARVRYLLGHLGSAVRGPFDLVVANLPYLPTGWLGDLPVEVRREPRAALDGGPDGLRLVRELLADLNRLLAARGWCLLELAEGQAATVATEASGFGLEMPRTVADAGGCERVAILGRARRDDGDGS